jgi:hypothetical protein
MGMSRTGWRTTKKHGVSVAPSSEDGVAGDDVDGDEERDDNPLAAPKPAGSHTIA